MRTKPLQLSVMAVAALAVFALAAVMLLSSGNPAQADTASLALDGGGNRLAPEQAGVGPGALPKTGDNEDYYDDPLPCSEEAQPDDTTVSVISEGYYAVFDGFWDYEVGHLSNNFCPPQVTQTEESTLTGTKIVTTRTDANIHISKTAFSIPDTYKVTVVDSAEANGNPSTASEPKIDLANYPFLRSAVSAVRAGPDSTKDNPTTVFADNSIWMVRLDEPGTTANETSPLKIGFSTDLMDGDYWDNPRGSAAQFQFVAMHVLEAGVPVEAHVVGANFFAFDQRETDTPLWDPKWSNVATDIARDIDMETGEYRPMQFAFTKPGVYRMQAQVQGHVRKTAPTGAGRDWSRISPNSTVNGPAEWYTFHVGPEADLGVTLTHTDETSDDDTTVTDGTASFSVTATNGGPSTSKGVVVEVSLPVGLDYVADATHTGVTYECGVISWKVGDLNKDQSRILNFTANVGAGAPKSLTVNAEGHSSTVDDNKANNTASVEVLSSSTVVRAPVFGGATRDIVEHAIAGTHAGDPVAPNNPDGRALTYSLSGRCSSWFQVHPNGQIVLASGRTLDYDEQSEFHLTLHVSDGVNATGGADTTIDDSEPVTINVIDSPDDAVHPTVTFSRSNPSSGIQPNLDLNHPVWVYTVQINTQLNDLPDGATPSYLWDEGYYGPTPPAYLLKSTYAATSGSAGTVTYTVHVKWDGGGITDSYDIEWFDP